MNMQRIMHCFLIIGTTLVMIGTMLFFKQGSLPLTSSLHPALLAQNTNNYLGPRQKIPGNPQLIRVQVIVNDDPNPQGVQVVEASFDQNEIDLKPRDIYGYRGQSSFQMPGGKYKLRWKVRRDKSAWPRTVSHEEEVMINPKDLWIQITINGETASIS